MSNSMNLILKDLENNYLFASFKQNMGEKKAFPSLDVEVNLA